jgi:hypothetical protein
MAPIVSDVTIDSSDQVHTTMSRTTPKFIPPPSRNGARDLVAASETLSANSDAEAPAEGPECNGRSAAPAAPGVRGRAYRGRDFRLCPDREHTRTVGAESRRRYA